MITSWYWHLLLLWVGGMAVGGKAIASRQNGHDDQYSVTFQNFSLTLGESDPVTFLSTGNGTNKDLSIILLQYNAGNPNPATNLVKVLDVFTGICITTESEDHCGTSSTILGGSLAPTTIKVDLEGTSNTTEAAATQNLVFCVGPVINTLNTCNYYSDVFDLAVPREAGSVSAVAVPPQVTFPSTMTISSATALAQLQLVSGTTTISPISVPTSTSSTPTSSVAVTTITSTPSSTSSGISSTFTPQPNKHSSGLSTGAKIGIALGALALVSLLLLLALFFLRKKHSKRALSTQTSQPEQVLLTRDMHTDSFARNQLILEKERNGSATITPHDGVDTPMEETSPTTSVVAAAQQQQRHSALSPYEPLPSAPYNGSISPRRKPAPSSPTTSSPLTNTNTNSPPSQSQPQTSQQSSSQNNTPPHSSNSSTTPASAFEAYHDIPLYGDARHGPQVFTNTISERERERGIESPFLREEMEGMTPEEVARLEEEERRIDAAIAAAEAGR